MKRPHRKTTAHTHPHLKGPHQSPRLPRFPLDPILRLYRDHHDPTARIAEQAGVSPKAVQRWVHTGLSFYKADALACSLGYHPATLWPNYYDDQPRTNRSLPSPRH